MNVAIDRSMLDDVLTRGFDDAPAEEILRWGFETFAPRIALSASFGSPEGMVLLDLMHGISPEQTRVFTIDTGRMHQATYELMDRVRNRYGITVEVYFPRAEAVQQMVRAHGLDLFYDSVALRQMCCGVRKVEPLERALADLDAWITGLRPGQSVTRGDVRAVEVDEVHGGRDRKSTRLNSSHITISYAVFCLKKKNYHDLFLTCTDLHNLLKPNVSKN